MQPPVECPAEPPGDVAGQEQRNQTANYKPNPGSYSEGGATRILTCRWIQRRESNCCADKCQDELRRERGYCACEDRAPRDASERSLEAAECFHCRGPGAQCCLALCCHIVRLGHNLILYFFKLLRSLWVSVLLIATGTHRFYLFSRDVDHGFGQFG